ncbi:hypothetical protein [Butyrivibrio sp. WCE2006]|uniref:hypothetical protein n=1 Tax=Butyrivibrio sp. WCE2006 TaxID=1410611 RepID=UPI0005D21D17|nr:hypothetical protein [Butyrivibrio sp. WCE2006]
MRIDNVKKVMQYAYIFCNDLFKCSSYVHTDNHRTPCGSRKKLMKQLLFRQLCALAALSVRMFYVLNIGFAPLPKATGMGKSSCCEHRKV